MCDVLTCCHALLWFLNVQHYCRVRYLEMCTWASGPFLRPVLAGSVRMHVFVKLGQLCIVH